MRRGESASILNEVLVDLNHERLAMQLKMDRLSRQETNDLLAAMFSEEITTDFLVSIFRQTEGNPFFIEEVCKTFIEAGQLSFQDGHLRCSEMVEIKIPQTVRAAIQARIHKLPSPTQEALGMSSILGREFDYETLKVACDLDEENLINALENAESAQLIVKSNLGSQQLQTLALCMYLSRQPCARVLSISGAGGCIYAQLRRLKQFIRTILRFWLTNTRKQERSNAPGSSMFAPAIELRTLRRGKLCAFIRQR